jgi:3',5'-cyclic-nucleotide phosphodiesterase
VTVCLSGSSCLAKISLINTVSRTELIPALVFVDIPHSGHHENKRDITPSTSPRQATAPFGEETFAGLPLLEHIANEAAASKISKLVVPIAVVSDSSARVLSARASTAAMSAGVISLSDTESSAMSSQLDGTEYSRCLNAGAADVLRSGFGKERAAGLAVHAFRAMKLAGVERSEFMSMKRDRQLSWVGVEEEKPYAYLREQMVSGLMDGICKPDNFRVLTNMQLPPITQDRLDQVSAAVGRWDFNAHDYSEQELIHGAFCIFEHAISMPALAEWRLDSDDLAAFLNACHMAYNEFVPYHNFRHVVDVLQAVFHFLVRLNIIPPYRNNVFPPVSPSNTAPISSVLTPFDALALLITAIGHDVGHPGVNNAFLVALNAPLAQLYNDRSVLESFHCAAYSQILRRYWPSAFASTLMRKSTINSILATDMAVHFDYMKRMSILRSELAEGANFADWDNKGREDTRALLSALLIKCADISNVVSILYSRLG